jgi:pyrroline-5-carboxylate reductase
MPNTPSFISKGLIAMNVSTDVTAENKKYLEEILGASGIVEYIEEKNFDAITGLSGSGPAFVYIAGMKALREHGFEKAVESAAAACIKRAEELGSP